MSPISIGYVDTHCHLNFKAFLDDAPEAIFRALENQVKVMIVVGTDQITNERAIKLAERFPNIWAAVGYHPIHVHKLQTDNAIGIEVDRIRDYCKHPRVVAIGEIGLDYYRKPFDKDRQKELLEGLLHVAADVNKPVVLHCREAMADLLKIIDRWGDQLKGVLHCFAGNWEQAQIVLSHGYYLGFNGLITYSGDEANIEVVRQAPLERLLLETDSPYLTPVTKRGQRNEPANITLVATEIANIKNNSVEEIKQATTLNAIGLFGIKL